MSTYRELMEKKVAKEIELLEEQIKEKKLPPKDNSFRAKLGKFFKEFQVIILGLVAITGGAITLTKPILDYIETRKNLQTLKFDTEFIASVDSIMNIPGHQSVAEKRLLFNLNKYQSREYVTFFMNALLYNTSDPDQNKNVVEKVAYAIAFRMRMLSLINNDNDAYKKEEELNKLVYERNEKFFNYILAHLNDHDLKTDPDILQQIINHIAIIKKLELQNVDNPKYNYPKLLTRLSTEICKLSDEESFKGAVICELPIKKKCYDCPQ